jgi:hypothetical protein
LGRPRVSPRTHKTMAKAFRLGDFMATLPPPPDSYDNTDGLTAWGMELNDSLGCCTCSTCGHMITAWTKGVIVPDSAILTEYEQSCGYNPADPSTDQGGMITTVLDYFRDTGVGGHRISAHAEVNLTQLRVQQATATFGAIDLGVNLPVSAQDQVGSVWDFVNDTPDEPGGWGGHSVPVVKYDSTGLWCVTWGALQQMTWRWFMYYVDEGHACISADWDAVDIAQLSEDLNEIGT